MAKKKAYDSIARELQDKLPQKKLILGTERTLKGLKNSTIQKVVVSSNASAQVKEDIAYYAGIGKVEIAEIPQTNEELGIICKKPFSIAIVGILKE